MTFNEMIGDKKVEYRIERVGQHGGKVTVTVDDGRVSSGFDFDSLHSLGLAIHHANVVALLRANKDGDVMSAMASTYTQKFVKDSTQMLEKMSDKFGGRPSA
jgi:hypothetical protein